MSKRVDVKSADDYQKGTTGAEVLQPSQRSQTVTTIQGQVVQKPNPYVLVEAKDSAVDEKDVKFSYPRSKIFVGGLDFKLTNEELREHFN